MTSILLKISMYKGKDYCDNMRGALTMDEIKNVDLVIDAGQGNKRIYIPEPDPVKVNGLGDTIKSLTEEFIDRYYLAKGVL